MAKFRRFLQLLIGTWRRRQRQEQMYAEFAHCKGCGALLSEWFVLNGYMYHPEIVGGCGWVSPWRDHAEFREVPNA